MNRLLAGVVGLGVGEQHARAFARHVSSGLRLVYDHDTARMTKVVAELGQGAPADGFAALLRDPEIDVISIASYDADHAAQVVAALQHGKHVFCEKPLCRSAEDLAAVERAWKGSGRHVASNLVLRSAPLYRWLREAIRAGELGEIYAFDGDYLYGRVSKITEGWRGQADQYSVTLGGGIHLVDLMLWLTGQTPRSVRAIGNQIATRGTAFRYDDFVAATYQFESGMVGRITSNFGCVHRHQHVVRIFGTKATFLYDDRGPRLHRTREPNEPSIPLDFAPLPPHKGLLIDEFIDQILFGVDTAPLTRHEFALVAACVGVDQALASGDIFPIG